MNITDLKAAVAALPAENDFMQVVLLLPNGITYNLLMIDFEPPQPKSPPRYVIKVASVA